MHTGFRFLAVLGLVSSLSAPAAADSILFSTNPTPDGAMAMASRPGVGGKIEIEAADDFFNAPPGADQQRHLHRTGSADSAAGPTPTIGEVVAELYHIFPLDSDTTRTPQVPTRANSPSDVAFGSRDCTSGSLTFTTLNHGHLHGTNSVLNGINKSPLQTTGGDGPVTGTEVQFN